MARLLADENFPIPVCKHLQALGHDLVTLAELGKANVALDDEAVLALATTENRTVLSHNRRDFLRLHRKDTGHAGIVICTYDPDFARQASRISQALDDVRELSGQLVRVNRPDR